MNKLLSLDKLKLDTLGYAYYQTTSSNDEIVVSAGCTSADILNEYEDFLAIVCDTYEMSRKDVEAALTWPIVLDNNAAGHIVDVLTLTRDTLLVSLINELGDGCNYTVRSYLDRDGCWTAQLSIQGTQKAAEDNKYYSRLI